jgi:energy-coupling factor transporter ATP-binding protein EcfA2
VQGSVEARFVKFRYGAADPDILKGVSLKIEAGEFVAMVIKMVGNAEFIPMPDSGRISASEALAGWLVDRMQRQGDS